MASVTSLTAEAIQAILDGVIISAGINGAGHLILTKQDGTTVDAGYAKGSSTLEAVLATPNTLARRDSLGRTQVATPADDADAANRGYVNNGDSTRTIPRLRLTAEDDAFETSTEHAFQVGSDSGLNLIIDNNEIMTRNNGVGTPLYVAYGVSAATESFTPTNAGDLTTKLYVDTMAHQQIMKISNDIPSGVDLNTYSTPGLYHQRINASAAAGANYPTPFAGMLEVFSSSDGAFVYQRYTVYKTMLSVFYRCYQNSAWGEWRHIAGAVGTAYSASVAVASGTTASQWTLANLDHSGGFSLSSGKMVVPHTGWYSIIGKVQFNANATGNRMGTIFINDATVSSSSAIGNGFSGNSWAQIVSATLRLSRGDTVGIGGWQTSGASLNGLGYLSVTAI